MEQHFQIFIDKEKNQIFMPMLRCNIGLWKTFEPWRRYKKEDWENIAYNIINMIEWLEKLDISKEFYDEFSLRSYDCLKKNGIKNFKKFSAQHIYISVLCSSDTEQVEICHWPRLPDGSYGINNDFTQEYAQPHVCRKDVEEIKKSFELAMLDAKKYLNKIHRELQ